MDVTKTLDTSIVIVTYNSARYIDACLASLPAACAHLRYETIVVDNASTDNTTALVRKQHPSVRIIDSGANLGFSKANNLGLAASTGTNVVILNPDTVADPSSITNLVEFLRAHPDVGIVAPQLLNPDRTDQGTARAFPTPAAALLGRRSPLTRIWPNNPWSRRYLIGRDHRGGEAFAVDWVSGACFMIRRDLARATGGFDEGFFMYWEDADWCRRVKGTGARVMCEPRATVVHDEGAQRQPTPRQVRTFHASAYRYYAKHHLTGAKLPLRPLVWALLMARSLAVIANSARRSNPPSTVSQSGRPQ